MCLLGLTHKPECTIDLLRPVRHGPHVALSTVAAAVLMTDATASAVVKQVLPLFSPAQGSIDAGEDLLAAEEASRPTLGDKDASRVQLWQHHLFVEIL
jgi:hypothetical protein